jgi:hypothetical protein
MNVKLYIRKREIISLILLAYICVINETAVSQTRGLYPPFTKWYQDPLSLKPLELSTAYGFVWGSTAIAACLILTKKDSAFQKRFSVYQETDFGFGYKPPYTNAIQNDFGVIYRLRNWMSIGAGGNTFYFRDKTHNTLSFGIGPFARWYPLNGKKASLFFEYGAGLSYSLDKFPLTGTGLDSDTARTGTRFNFTTKYGMGAEIHFNSKLSLQAGIRHFHLSNGNIKGIQRNPSHDSNGFFAGFIYTSNPTGTSK